MIEKFVEKLQQTKDIILFRSFVSSLDDINKNLMESEDNSLNLLHICIGLEECEFSLECIHYLLSVPDFNINCVAKINGTLGISGAHIAVDWNHYRILKTLIDNQIDLFICDSYGKSAKDHAIEKGDRSAQRLIQKGIDNYLCHKFHSIQVLNDNHLIKSEVNPQINSGFEKFAENMSEVPKSPKAFDKTIEYFDENQNVWESIDNNSNDSLVSSDSSGNTLISNISYEKTESLKSFCSDKTEVYLYNDRDHNIVLIEQRFEGCPNNSSSDLSLSDKQIVSKGSATQTVDHNFKQIQDMNSTEIFNELKSRGDSPGPILPTTRKYYMKRLLDYRRGTLSPSKQVLALPNHSLELNLLLQKKFPFNEVLKLEKHFIEFFEKSNDCNDCQQNNFIYLLIDPNISENIPLLANNTKIVVNSDSQIETNLLMKFIKSIFYVGKGQSNRVYQHFYEAIKTDDTRRMSPKVKRIHEIWSSNKGVVSCHCFHDITAKEALAREAMIISALNLSNLTNQISGHSIRGLKWNQRKRHLFGSYLLLKSFGVYVVTGERQIRRPLNH